MIFERPVVAEERRTSATGVVFRVRWSVAKSGARGPELATGTEGECVA